MKTRTHPDVAHTEESLEYFGRCPHCGTYEDCLNIGPELWIVCHTHRTKWIHSAGIFEWSHQSEDEWYRNWLLLKDYEDISPN